MTQDILGTAGDAQTNSARAQRAVKAFRGMQPGLTGYARAITGKRDVEVKISEGQPRTDGKNIFFKPPIALGDNLGHVRGKCDRRDPSTLVLQCPACALREDVLIKIYHEIAHIAFGTFEPVSEKARTEALERAIQEVPTRFADKVRARWDKIPDYKKRDHLNLASLISPFLPVIVNALEDSRVDTSMFKARKGTRVMFDAMTRLIFEQGVEMDDGSIFRWSERPHNSQITVGIFCLAHGYEIEGWFSPEVEAGLMDDKLRALVKRIETTRSAEGVYELAFPVLARLRELGFRRPPEDEDGDPDDNPTPPELPQDPTPEENPNDEEQPQDPSDDEAGGGDGAEAEADEPGDPADEAGAEGEPSADPGEDGEADEGGADPGDGEQADAPGDRAHGDGDAADGSADDPDAASDDDPDASDGGDEPSRADGADPGDGEVGAGDGPVGGDDAAEAAAPGRDGGDQDDDALPGDDGVGSGADADSESGDGAAEPDGADAPEQPAPGGAGDAGPDDGEPADGSADAGGVGGEVREPEGPPGGGPGEDRGGDDAPADDDGLRPGDAPGPDGPEELGLTDGDDEGDDPERAEPAAEPDGGGGEDLEEPGDDGDAERGPDGEGRGDGDDTDEAPDDPSDAGLPDDAGPRDAEDVEPFDGGADEGQGGTETDAPYEPIDKGSAEDALRDVQIFGKHEADHSQPHHHHQDGDDDSAEEQKEVDRAIIQGQYFEKPSVNVYGVRKHLFGQPGDEHADAWMELDEWSRDYYAQALKRHGIDADTTVPESVLGPVLLEMRRAFSDNKRANMQRNLKSGRVNGRVLGGRAWHGDPRLFEKKRVPGKKSYAVILGIDISGSTSGLNLALAKRAAMAQAELCNRMGITFAIYAHTANPGPSGNYETGLMLDMYEIKSFDQPWNPDTKLALDRIQADAENLDGHGVEFYRKLIERRPETDKVILYYTDGAMPAANYAEELEILQREIKYCKGKQIALLGVGIRTDSPRRHGLDTVQVDDDSDMVKVIRHLESALLSNR